MNTQDFEIQIKTFFGLETLLSEELRALGARDIEVKNRAVVCRGDLGFLYKINYSLRTGVKVLVPVFRFRAYSEQQFYDKLYRFAWDKHLRADQSFAFDATLHSQTFSHSQFMTLKAKDALVDFFRDHQGTRPNVDTKNPDIKFNLHIENNEVTLSLDSSGDPLFKRGYRKEGGEAPINEVLAAGMLLLAGWDGKGNFLDPMCGSGTLLIEAAMIAQKLPAQLYRKNFGFEKWKNFDPALFKSIKEFRLNRMEPFEGQIWGYDISDKMLSHARENIEFAELEDVITLKKQDFFESKKELFPLLMVFNPPYDERLEISDPDFYKKIGDTFKSNYPNTLAYLITSDLEAPKKIGLRPSRRIKLFNGKLETRFLQYEMYEGSKKNKEKNP